MTLQEVLKRFPDTRRAEWAVVGFEGFMHKDCTTGPEALFTGGVFRSGRFLDGHFRGGIFEGGTFRGGYFRGGEFYGGTYEGGHFYEGTFKAGFFKDGIFRGGHYRGGTFFGGEFLGGTYRSGRFFGGTYKEGIFNGTPLQIFGLLPWIVNVGGPNRVSIGGQCHTLKDWQKNLKQLMADYGVPRGKAPLYRRVLKEAAQWFEDNPGLVT